MNVSGTTVMDNLRTYAGSMRFNSSTTTLYSTSSCLSFSFGPQPSNVHPGVTVFS